MSMYIPNISAVQCLACLEVLSSSSGHAAGTMIGAHIQGYIIRYIIQICSGIICGRVLNGMLYAQKLQKLKGTYGFQWRPTRMLS